MRQWQVATNITYGRSPNNPWSYTQTQSGARPTLNGSDLITNADRGAVMSWVVGIEFYCAAGTDQGCTSNVDGWTEYHLTNSAGNDVIWPAAVTGQATYVLPVLQLQDGTYLGVVESFDGNTYEVKFNTSGNVLATAGGYTSPQIATVGGGFIATADGGFINPGGGTFDANLNVTGQLASLPIQSWTGNAYQYGSAEQVAFVPIGVAAGFWSFASANTSANNTAIKQQLFPPLASCTTAPGCIGQNEAIYNALDDLIARLPAIRSLADRKIFNLLGNDWNNNKLSTDSFIRYLTSRRPRFYNGLLSTYCYDALAGGKLCKYPPFSWLSASVEDYLTSSLGQKADASSGTPSHPLLTFFRPNSILYDNLGRNGNNEAVIFHEALHGQTGLPDNSTITHPGPGILEKLGANSGDASCVITQIIWLDVLQYSPALKTPPSCP